MASEGREEIARADRDETSLQPAKAHELDDHHARWTLIRDVVVFQMKLVVDGLKDLVLAPLSIVAGVLDVFRPEREGRGRFYRLVRRGHDFDRWVDLFEAAHRKGDAESDALARSEKGMDAQLRALESMLADQVARGDLTRKAKDAIDGGLDAIRDRLDRSKKETAETQGRGGSDR